MTSNAFSAAWTRLTRAGLVLALVFLSAEASAKWTYHSDTVFDFSSLAGQEFDSIGAISAQLGTLGGWAGGSEYVIVDNYWVSTYDGEQYVRFRGKYNNNPNVYNVTFGFDPTSCPDGTSFDLDGRLQCAEQLVECPFNVGQVFQKSGNGSPPATRCDNSCASQREGAGLLMGGGWYAEYSITGTCGPSEETNDGAVDGANCIQTAGGTQYCADTAGTPGANCGTVNGEYVCLAEVPPGNCLFTPGGQAICDGSSQANAPDETITVDGGSIDVYQDATTTGGTAGGNGTSTGTGTGDNGTTAGTSTGGDGLGGDGEGATGVLPGENETVCEFDQCFANFYSRVQAAPIVAASSGMVGTLPAGTCSGFTSESIQALDGVQLTIDAHCTIWPTISPIIYGIMLVVFTLLGGLIILRA